MHKADTGEGGLAQLELSKVYAEDFAYARADLCRYLAGGEGKRMKSNHPKVLASVLFKPMLQWVMDAAEGAEVRNCAW